MKSLPPALAPMGAREQFVTWFAQPSPTRPGKVDKFPCDWRTGHVINAQDPAFWTSAAVAIEMAPAWDRGHGCGAGFVFTEADPFFFLDIDKCLLPDGRWSPLALELCARLGPGAQEVSQSGAGLHIFGSLSRPLEHACRNTPLGLELYTSGRFVALTGINIQGDAGADLTDAVAIIAAQYFPPSVTGDFAGWTTDPVAEWKGPADDEELIRRARASALKSAALAFGGEGKPTFEDLWTANGEALGRQWPPDKQGQAYNASDADMALANHLAFWTGKNCERIERLMRMSALARDKWDSHRSYMGDTILKACAYVTKVASGRAEAETIHVPPPEPEVLAQAAEAAGRKTRDANREYMGPLEQLQHFEGCYFVSKQQQVFSLPLNDVMPRGAFDVIYGGHLFVIDPMGAKTTDSAWDAFTKSRVNVPATVNDLCFRPEIPSGAIVTEGPRTWVNSYVPYHCPAAPGDITPWATHLAKLLPDAGDRAILENWLGSMVQNLGVKFQWWPVIQGVAGNGKTLLLDAMRYVAGDHYSHLPNAHAMARDGMKFNSWIDRKLFIGVEEISLQNKRDFLDEFKVVVTNRRIPLEGKGTNQTNGDNRANGILLTNHRDGVPVTADDRRYAIFYCAQQVETDLARDGMDGEYFPNLYGWLRAGGFAIVAHYYKTFPLQASLDPAQLAHRPPKTSSSAEAVRASLGRAEQEVLDAIEEGRPGFAGGWVSSKYLDALLDAIRAPVPRNKRRALMQSLGYDWHPVLPEGRVNDTVTPDAGKPKLYIKAGHLALSFTTPAEIARQYSKAQEPGAVITAAATAFK